MGATFTISIRVLGPGVNSIGARHDEVMKLG